MNENTAVTVALTEIDTALLLSGQPYQRPVTEKRLRELQRNWDPQLLDPLVVSFRDGKFYLVDGQHRAVVQRRILGRDSKTLCKLYHGLSYEAEAKLCWKLDKASVKLSNAQAVKALIEADDDPELMEIQRLIEANGFKWELTKRIPGDNEIIAVRAVINAYHLLGGASFDRMLRLMKAAWQGSPSSLRAGFRPCL